MNTEKLNNMSSWERQKAIFLMGLAEDLGMDLSNYGEIAVNESSGYTYLWLEDFNFTLFMPINCKLKKSDVYALWTNNLNGEELEMSLEENTSLTDLENWAEKQEKSLEEPTEFEEEEEEKLYCDYCSNLKNEKEISFKLGKELKE